LLVLKYYVGHGLLKKGKIISQFLFFIENLKGIKQLKFLYLLFSYFPGPGTN